MKIVKLHYGMFEVRSKDNKPLAVFNSQKACMKWIKKHNKINK